MITRNPPAFTVTDRYDGAAVPEVEATLTDASSNVRALDCAYVSYPGTCSWPKGSPIVGGTYLLRITAPYFESIAVEEKVITSSYCGAIISQFQPEQLSLQRL
jgi:hypothetical protein